MIRINKTFLFLMLAALGVWGCSKSSGDVREANRLRALEVKVNKLEDDLQTAEAARDLLHQKVENLEKERAQVARQVQILMKERTDLRQQVQNRTAERDAVQSQYETFRKEIRNLLGQAEAAAAQSSGQPVTSSIPVPTHGSQKTAVAN
jgi:chromosome segregation ATPase